MTTLLAVGAVGAIGGLFVTLVVLTTTGARSRGMRWVGAVVAGVAFPITWMVWYAVDELPRRVPGRLHEDRSDVVA